jgi:hypothetical protein
MQDELVHVQLKEGLKLEVELSGWIYSLQPDSEWASCYDPALAVMFSLCAVAKQQPHVQ